MKRLLSLASSFVFAVALVAGCRGSVDRVYDDGVVITLSPEAGGAETGATDAGGDGGPKEHADASADAAPPITAPATIRVTVGGLKGTGLVLQNNEGDDLPVAADGSYPFTTAIPPGKPYKVTVANQPSGPSQTCTVTKGEGTAAGVDVVVNVDCVTATYPVGGTVVGLGAGKEVKLQNNAGNDITVTGDGPFTFPPVGSGNAFHVTILSSSPGTTCNVSGGDGTVVTSAVDSVVVNCGTNTYTVGGTVTGLAGTVIVTNNDGNNRTISANGSFAFSLPIASGASYDVKVKTQPAYPPQTQVCTVSNGSGTVGAANVTNVAINCTTTKYTVGGTVNGLTGAGLKLQNKGTDDKSISPPGGAFTFATQVPSGSSYNVTVVSQPAGQTCTVVNPSGTMRSANVTGVTVNCGAPAPLEEHFDGVTEPALPPGWTTVALVDPNATLANAWTTVSDTGDFKSAPNAAFIENIGMIRDVALVSPVFQVASATAKLTFWNHYFTEDDWDGGVLEIKIGSLDWADIIAAGGSFNGGGYDLTLIQAPDGSTLGGRDAWNGRDTTTTTVNLPASCAGQNVQLRWRWASDDGASEDGWWIDDVVVTN